MKSLQEVSSLSTRSSGFRSSRRTQSSGISRTFFFGKDSEPDGFKRLSAYSCWVNCSSNRSPEVVLMSQTRTVGSLLPALIWLCGK